MRARWGVAPRHTHAYGSPAQEARRWPMGRCEGPGCDVVERIVAGAPLDDREQRDDRSATDKQHEDRVQLAPVPDGPRHEVHDEDEAQKEGRVLEHVTGDAERAHTSDVQSDRQEDDDEEADHRASRPVRSPPCLRVGQQGSIPHEHGRDHHADKARGRWEGLAPNEYRRMGRNRITTSRPPNRVGHASRYRCHAATTSPAAIAPGSDSPASEWRRRPARSPSRSRPATAKRRVSRRRRGRARRAAGRGERPGGVHPVRRAPVRMERARRAGDIGDLSLDRAGQARRRSRRAHASEP